jgi:hypothetical protein
MRSLYIWRVFPLNAYHISLELVWDSINGSFYLSERNAIPDQP